MRGRRRRRQSRQDLVVAVNEFHSLLNRKNFFSIRHRKCDQLILTSRPILTYKKSSTECSPEFYQAKQFFIKRRKYRSLCLLPKGVELLAPSLACARQFRNWKGSFPVAGARHRNVKAQADQWPSDIFSCDHPASPTESLRLCRRRSIAIVADGVHPPGGLRDVSTNH